MVHPDIDAFYLLLKRLWGRQNNCHVLCSCAAICKGLAGLC